MDPELRGLLEMTIDNFLTEKSLESSIGIMRHFKPFIKSEEEAIFGYMIGILQSLNLTNIVTKYNRLPNKNEINTFGNIIESKAPYIKSKIREAVNR